MASRFLGATYVRDLIERGRGTKERLELICDATGISFDFVWNNRGAAVASADPGSEPDLIISSGFLRGAVEEALRLIGASLEESKVIAGLLLTKIAREQTPGATGRS